MVNNLKQQLGLQKQTQPQSRRRTRAQEHSVCTRPTATGHCTSRATSQNKKSRREARKKHKEPLLAHHDARAHKPLGLKQPKCLHHLYTVCQPRRKSTAYHTQTAAGTSAPISPCPPHLLITQKQKVRNQTTTRVCVCVHSHTPTCSCTPKCHNESERERKSKAYHSAAAQCTPLSPTALLSLSRVPGRQGWSLQMFCFQARHQERGEKQRGWEGKEGEGEGVGTSVCVCRVCVCAVASTAKAKSIDPTPPRPRLLPPPPPPLHLPCDCLLSKRTTALLPKQPMPTVVFFFARPHKHSEQNQRSSDDW